MLLFETPNFVSKAIISVMSKNVSHDNFYLYFFKAWRAMPTTILTIAIVDIL